MSALRIARVDVGDVAAFGRWYDVYRAGECEGREAYATPWQREEMRAILGARTSRAWSGAWLGSVDGEAVASGWMRTPLLDNLDRAEIAVQVRPGHRRRGHGRALLGHLEQQALERGRTLWVGESAFPYAAGPEGAGEPGPEFARATGYRLALGDVQRELRLPVADAVLDDLAATAAPHHAAYTLRSWVGPVPDDLVEGWAALAAVLMTEAPIGELDVEPERVSVAAVREDEALLAAQGRTKVHTVAQATDGEVVAYTDLVVTVHEPDRAYQWGTLVRRDHRGHRLGLAVKVANLRLLQAQEAGIRRVTTYNAEVNAPMIGVNEVLGYVPVARLGEFQRRATG